MNNMHCMRKVRTIFTFTHKQTFLWKAPNNYTISIATAYVS